MQKKVLNISIPKDKFMRKSHNRIILKKKIKRFINEKHRVLTENLNF